MVRVYELAKEFGIESRDVMSALREMGEFVRSASSTVERPVVLRLREKFAGQRPVRYTPPFRPSRLPNVSPSLHGTRHVERESSAPIYRTGTGSPVKGFIGEQNPEFPAQGEYEKLVGDILATWERIRRCVPESSRNISRWLAHASGINNARIEFARSVRNWIAHPDNEHRPHQETLREAIRVMLEIERKLP